MSDQPKKRWSAGSVVMTTVVVLALYVLSVGPVGFFVEKFGIEPNDQIGQVLSVFYAPLIWIHENVDVSQNYFDWYGRLWHP